MNIMTLGISLLALGIVMASWIMYLRTIPKMKVPVDPMGSKIFQGTGICLGVSAIIIDGQGSESSGFIVFIPAILAVLLGFGFFWLLAQRKTPIGDLKVKVGDKILSFTAATSEGIEFNTDELTGKRILLKFFRGGW